MEAQGNKAKGSLGTVRHVGAIGGVGLLLSSALTWQSSIFEDNTVVFLQAVIPLVSALLGEGMRVGIDWAKEQLAVRRIRKAKTRAKNVLDDERASDEVKVRAQKQYDYYLDLLMQTEVMLELPKSAQKVA